MWSYTSSICQVGPEKLWFKQCDDFQAVWGVCVKLLQGGYYVLPSKFVKVCLIGTMMYSSHRKNITWNSLQVDDKTLLASSGEGTVQSFDLRYRKPDIQSEVREETSSCLKRTSSGWAWWHLCRWSPNHPLGKLSLEGLIPATFPNKLDRFMAFKHMNKIHKMVNTSAYP